MADNDTPPPPSAPGGNCWPTSRTADTFRMTISMNIFSIEQGVITTVVKNCNGDSTNSFDIRPTIDFKERWSYTMVFTKDSNGNFNTDINAYTGAFDAKIAAYQSEAGTKTTEILNTIQNKVCQPERRCRGVVTPEIRKDCGQIKTKTVTTSISTGGYSATGSGGNCRFT